MTIEERKKHFIEVGKFLGQFQAGFCGNHKKRA